MRDGGVGMRRKNPMTEARRQYVLSVAVSFLTALTAGAAAGFAIPEDQRGWFSNPVLAWIIVVGSLLSLSRGIVVSRSNYLRMQDDVHAGPLTQAGLGLLQEVSDLADVPYFELGVSVYIYDAGALRNRAWFGRRTTFRRPVRLRYPADERRSGLQIRPGLGAVGLAFEAPGKFAVQPCAHYFRRYQNDEDGWNALPDNERAGLTYGQLMLCKKYGLVAAQVIRNEHGEPAGCISVDGPAHREEQMIDKIDGIKGAMEDAAITVRKVLFPLD